MEAYFIDGCWLGTKVKILIKTYFLLTEDLNSFPLGRWEHNPYLCLGWYESSASLGASQKRCKACLHLFWRRLGQRTDVCSLRWARSRPQAAQIWYVCPSNSPMDRPTQDRGQTGLWHLGQILPATLVRSVWHGPLSIASAISLVQLQVTLLGLLRPDPSGFQFRHHTELWFNSCSLLLCSPFPSENEWR